MASRDISICDQTGSDSSRREIQVCNDTDPSGREIVICLDCSDPLALGAISGPDSVSGGSQYSVTGGVAPLVWSISCGAINSSTGAVTSVSGCCGTGSVSVTDACGQTASKEVMFPDGTYVQTGWTTSLFRHEPACTDGCVRLSDVEKARVDCDTAVNGYFYANVASVNCGDEEDPNYCDTFDVMHCTPAYSWVCE